MRTDAFANHVTHVADDDHCLRDALRSECMQCPHEQGFPADFGKTFGHITRQCMKTTAATRGKNDGAMNGARGTLEVRQCALW